ncbi:MAG: ABC transporter substrate-binding protein [Gemmatimonadaceae bacterium]|nr:ABC transporter substrate-binding protein [Acetobacteraceae bacterium]
MRRALLASACLIGLALPATAATFRWANDGDANSMDPYTRNETFLLTFTQNIYDPLVRRNRELKVEPALAQRMEQIDPLTWRFHLRPNVKFHGGEAFTADDVLFSYKRATGPGSQINANFATVKEVNKIDDLTVDFVTKVPDPIFLQQITTWGIMSKQWAEKNNAVETVDLTKTKEENFATRNANGTGPFILGIREPDRRTTLKNNPAWWDTPQHNLTDVTFNVISSANTRVAALLSGDVDMIYTVPPQDMERIGRTQGLKLAVGPELRTIFFGFDQSRPELLKSDVKGKNPFQDIRVRMAFNMAVDAKAIQSRVMRGQSRPTGSMFGPGVNGHTEALDVRHPYDPEAAKKLLAEAGYPNGFGVTLDCPNDRYINDEPICQAVTAMLARIGMRVTLNAQTRLQYFAQINNPNYNTSFYMLGWTPTTYDAHNALFNLAGTRNGVRGVFNSAGFSNAEFDTLVDQIAVETAPAERQAKIERASKILHDQAAFIPLHQQTVVWAFKNNVDLQQLADNTFPLRYVTVK